jgi:hypothetical protein
VLKHQYVDYWHKMDDATSFAMTRRLIRTEGLLCGGSSGCAMASALKFLEEDEEGRKIAATPGANVVVILPDRCVGACSSCSVGSSLTHPSLNSVRNYITRSWLDEPEGGEKTIGLADDLLSNAQIKG